MTDSERREAARQFINKWNGKGQEDEDDRSYWLDILQRIMGADDATDRIEFQKKVSVNGNTKRIDAYIPETRVIIEQKTLGIALDKKIHQSGDIDLTPYEQAKRYNDNLPFDEKARWIVTSNFSEIWVYDMNTKIPENNITKIFLMDLQSHYSMLDFLLSKKVKKITEEMELSLQAGELVGKIHDRFEEQYNDPLAKKTQNSLNILCVRLVFCLYAEDAGLFGAKDAFSKYIAQYEPKDIRRALLDLFKVLDTPIENRGELYLDEELEAFPFCNGGLFARENIEIPKITQEIKDTLLESSRFNWSRISPTIFGAVFESTLNPETRRSGGMHYTSIENIHKVIDPLFLDDLKAEFAEIMEIGVPKTREKKLQGLQNKLAGLKFLDPACGSGNFLTETYVSLRRLENEILRELQHGQIMLDIEGLNPIKVGIHQFYGIEINDFAVTVAKTALWIAESQMMQETEDIIQTDLDFLPLKTNASIIEGNALQMDWNRVVHKNELSYIMGNPPFVGARMMEQGGEQKGDVKAVFGNIKDVQDLDYVTCWYKLAAKMMLGTHIEAALVSTNSICQGSQVPILWNVLLNEYNVHINFAHQTFKWNSESRNQAAVHCVIIGFSCFDRKKKVLYTQGIAKEVTGISPYLVEGSNSYVTAQKNAICDVPKMNFGNQPRDGGHFVISPEEREALLARDPSIEKWLHPYIGAEEFIKGKQRWCLWLKHTSPSDIKSSKILYEKVSAVREFRLASKAKTTNGYAKVPHLFAQITQPDNVPFLLIPSTTSSNRRYIPIGFMEPEIISSNLVMIVPNATKYHFGILTSNVHMAWMRLVCGRLGNGYRYTKEIVYNTFPWPTPTEEQKAKIEKTAQAILDARSLYPDASLADLYDELTMPPELRKAHQDNDRAVMAAYGFDVRTTTEASCVAKLMTMYQALVAND
ncbi:MAG: methylase [Oscillospiraceae bacterium]|nr:methylase [Oscillospiraceae bacterium]